MSELYNKWKNCGCPICKIAIFSYNIKKRIESPSKRYELDKN